MIINILQLCSKCNNLLTQLGSNAKEEVENLVRKGFWICPYGNERCGKAKISDEPEKPETIQ